MGTLNPSYMACFSVGETSEGGGIRPPPFEDTEWSDKKFVVKHSFYKKFRANFHKSIPLGKFL